MKSPPAKSTCRCSTPAAATCLCYPATFTQKPSVLISAGPTSAACSMNRGNRSLALRTESDGGFSFDYNHKDPVVYFLYQKQVYACPVTVKPREDALIYLGEVHCKAIALDALPGELTQLSRVSALLAQR